ncbi:lysozyme [Butyrivibrio sp. INlla18]|uniref:GH25 family lysozyme n=1 Tax=Butyrivibrio sp. INlla18 TaxID=1520806 RepID=UPI00088D92C5|nr:GH25 family lysozyme [Butyrivibrio sp. INlla18]SDA66049.1 lysozyme [Butyrivibrio sp. INlla18]
MKKKILISAAALVILAALMGLTAGLFYFGVLHINNPSKRKYPIRGVDVAHYQGVVDWEVLSKEDISFAYIKATEGSSSVDEQFEKNWNEAQNTDLRIGAYHFFSLDSSGATQAENFCKTVTPVPGMLPPVVDVEPYGGYREPDMLDKDKMLAELGDFLDGVETCYSMKPVIYTTEEWLPVIQERFADYDVWIRNVYGKPDPSINWTFWQYSNRHVLSGYYGTERYIDMNVFYGDEETFSAYN